MLRTEIYDLWDPIRGDYDPSLIAQAKKDFPAIAEQLPAIMSAMGLPHWGLITSHNLAKINAAGIENIKSIIQGLQYLRSNSPWETKDNRTLTQEAFDLMLDDHPASAHAIAQLIRLLPHFNESRYRECLPAEFFKFHQDLRTPERFVIILMALPSIQKDGRIRLRRPRKKPGDAIHSVIEGRIYTTELIIQLVQLISLHPQHSEEFTYAMHLFQSKNILPKNPYAPHELFMQHPDKAHLAAEGLVLYHSHFKSTPKSEHMQFMAAYPGENAVRLLILLESRKAFEEPFIGLLTQFPCNQEDAVYNEKINIEIIEKMQLLFRSIPDEITKNRLVEVIKCNLHQRVPMDIWLHQIVDLLIAIHNANTIAALIQIAFRKFFNLAGLEGFYVLSSSTKERISRYITGTDSEINEYYCDSMIKKIENHSAVIEKDETEVTLEMQEMGRHYTITMPSSCLASPLPLEDKITIPPEDKKPLIFRVLTTKNIHVIIDVFIYLHKRDCSTAFYSIPDTDLAKADSLFSHLIQLKLDSKVLTLQLLPYLKVLHEVMTIVNSLKAHSLLTRENISLIFPEKPDTIHMVENTIVKISDLLTLLLANFIHARDLIQTLLNYLFKPDPEASQLYKLINVRSVILHLKQYHLLSEQNLNTIFQFSPEANDMLLCIQLLVPLDSLSSHDALATSFLKRGLSSPKTVTNQDQFNAVIKTIRMFFWEERFGLSASTSESLAEQDIDPVDTRQALQHFGLFTRISMVELATPAKIVPTTQADTSNSVRNEKDRRGCCC